MNILQKLKQDIKNTSIEKEVEQLRVVLKEYMILLNNTLETEGGMSFDYVGGSFHHQGYFNFNKESSVVITVKDSFCEILILGGFMIEYRFFSRSKNLNNWNYSLTSITGKSDLNILIEDIKSHIQQLKG